MDKLLQTLQCSLEATVQCADIESIEFWFDHFRDVTKLITHGVGCLFKVNDEVAQ